MPDQVHFRNIAWFYGHKRITILQDLLRLTLRRIYVEDFLMYRVRTKIDQRCDTDLIYNRHKNDCATVKLMEIYGTDS